MARLLWSQVGTRFYETGIDRGVLYVPGSPGVAWSGITSVAESPTGGESRPFYMDGIRYLDSGSSEEFEATISAYYSPQEFDRCDGTTEFSTGMFAHQQKRSSFGLSYRTLIGNDVVASRHGYKTHLIYNAMAEPTERPHNTMSDDPSAETLNWKISTRPAAIPGLRPSAHVTIDSLTTNPWALDQIENLLYGTNSTSPQLPTPFELKAINDILEGITVVEHSDGTYTVTGPDEYVSMLDSITFQIDWPSVTLLAGGRFDVHSA